MLIERRFSRSWKSLSAARPEDLSSLILQSAKLISKKLQLEDLTTILAAG